MPRFSALAVAFLLLAASPTAAQRLSGTVVPEHYALWFAPNLQEETFRGRATHRGAAEGPVHVHHAARRGDGLRRGDHHRRRGHAGGHSDAERRRRNGDAHRAATDPRGRGQPRDRLHRRPQRQAARVLHQQGERPQLCGDADGTDRCTAGIPVVRRAGLQGHLRHLAHGGQQRHRHLQWRAGVGHGGPGAGQAHAHLRAHAEDVHLPGGDDRRRLRLPRGRIRRHHDSHLLDTGQARADGLRARGRRTAGQVLQRLLRHQVSVRQAGYHRGARLRRRRHGERRRHHLPRTPAARRSAAVVGGRAEERRVGDLARDRPPVVRQPGDDEVVGRHLAERGVRHLDGEQATRRLASRMADASSPTRRTRRRRSASTACARRARFAPRWRPPTKSTRCSTGSPTRRPPVCCG